MANHDPENNSVEIACELLMAIAQAGFTRPAQAVLSYALIQVCGPRKAKVALLDRKALRLGSNVSLESHIRRAIKELVDAGVISKTVSGHYSFNGDYESWNFDGQLLLTPCQVAFCKSFSSPHALDSVPAIDFGDYLLSPSFPRNNPVPRSLKKEVFERDDYRCVNCGSRWEIGADHIIPTSKGGPSALDNLQTLCRSCNSRKGNRLSGQPAKESSPNG